MPPDTATSSTASERPMLPTLKRFLPYLWPADAPMLRLRIVGAMLLVAV